MVALAVSGLRSLLPSRHGASAVLAGIGSGTGVQAPAPLVAAVRLAVSVHHWLGPSLPTSPAPSRLAAGAQCMPPVHQHPTSPVNTNQGKRRTPTPRGPGSGAPSPPTRPHRAVPCAAFSPGGFSPRQGTALFRPAHEDRLASFPARFTRLHSLASVPSATVSLVPPVRKLPRRSGHPFVRPPMGAGHACREPAQLSRR